MVKANNASKYCMDNNKKAKILQVSTNSLRICRNTNIKDLGRLLALMLMGKSSYAGNGVKKLQFSISDKTCRRRPPAWTDTAALMYIYYFFFPSFSATSKFWISTYKHTQHPSFCEPAPQK